MIFLTAVSLVIILFFFFEYMKITFLYLSKGFERYHKMLVVWACLSYLKRKERMTKRTKIEIENQKKR